MLKVTKPQETVQRDITPHILEWKLKKKKKTKQNRKKKKKQLTGIDKDVEKLEYWNTADRKAKYCSHYGRYHGGSLKIELPYYLAMKILGIYILKNLNQYFYEICTPIFITMFFILA